MNNKLLVVLGRLLGVLGVLACVAAVLARLAGYYWIGSIPSGIILQGGVAVIIMAVLAFVAR